MELPFEDFITPKKQACYDGLTAIIIEEDTEVSRQLSQKLTDIGMEVLEKQNVQQALIMIKQAHEQNKDFNYCFVNDTVSAMDGLEVIRQIRKMADKEHTKILVLTYDTTDLDGMAKKTGANGFIIQPMFQFAILEALEKIELESLPSFQTESMVSYDFKGKHILIAEDNKINMEIALGLLDATGAILDKAENGLEAIDQFAASEVDYYDLILMDIQRLK